MKRTYLTLITTILLFACQKDAKEILTILRPEYIKTSIQGKILDDNQQPVAGATVVIGKHTTRTNARGIFRLDSIDVDIHASVVKVSKTGYFNGFRTFVANKGILNFVQLQLITSNIAGKFAAANGGTVTVPNGGSITFTGGSIVTAATNVAYTGNVNVSAHFINPILPELPQVMPGDLRGITTTGQEKSLQSFGMMAVELTDDAGVKLQLSKPATLTMPVPATLRATAPATIPLWSFNETNGLWKEEGTATKKDTSYIATVTHFSYWNCDVPYPKVSFQAVVTGTNGERMFDMLVRMKVENENYYAYGRTDSTGKVSGYIPAGKSLEITITNKCGNIVYIKKAGPFTQDADLGILGVSIPYGGNVIISGMAVNCNGAPVTKGNAFIFLEDNYYSAKISNGSFTFSMDRCDMSPTEVSLTVQDEDASKESAPSTFNITAGTYNVGTYAACAISTVEYFNITVDGTAYTAIPNDSLTGFSYWNNRNNVNMSTNKIWFNTYADGTTTGTFQLSDISLRTEKESYDEDMLSHATNQMTFTEYGGVDKYAAGTFSAKMIGRTTSNNINISGSFRLKIR
ncbi:carboxypeptidase-like regulatory domain-containing protein [Chitinophaga sp. YR573]|uniref:carboxypeptidase-like regulatory domain-containing protein n=1 Tax=Chitinophaga sp. YR573 TaxID=1881040 RepID=UPI0015A573FA|nr:carboxypeptidase-like regulatory domain-containing protein [Chitinophaga sp. YR573]